MPTAELPEPDDAVRWLGGAGFQVLLADTDDAVHDRPADHSGRVALVVGSERYGVSRAPVRARLRAVAGPMLGVADSLNVSVSASVLLYEARARQDGW